MTQLQDYGITYTQDQYIGKGSNPEESNDYEIARQLQEYDNNPNVEYPILERQQSHLDQSKSSEHPINSNSETGAESPKNPSSTKSEKILSNNNFVKGSDMAKRFSFLQDRKESNPEIETQNIELPEGSSQKQDDINNLTDFKIDNQNDQSAVKDNVQDDSLVANEKTGNKLYPNLSLSLPLSTPTTNDDNYQHTNKNSATSDFQAADHRDNKDTPAIYSSQMSEEPNAHILMNTDLDEIYKDPSNIPSSEPQKTTVLIKHNNVINEYKLKDITPHKVKTDFNIQYGILELTSDEIISKEKSDNEFEPPLVPGAYTLTVQDPKKFTVIFLGESGVGKSTLISGLGNYLNWSTFEEAKKNQMQICIPVEFKVHRKLEKGGFGETTVRAGDFEDNENFNDVGQSVTQKPKVHQFTFQNNTVKVIDTPGLSEYGYSDLDREKLKLIKNCVHEQENIHAICIALKSDGSTLNNHYIVTLRWLLSIFPKIALSNVFFFFTHADRTRFETETALELLQEIQQKLKDIYGEIFKLQSWNTYSVDSESFKYLLSKEQGVKYSNRPEKYFAYCWEETSSQIRKFLNCITTIQPINKEVIINVHKLKASDSQLRIQGPIKTEDESVISKGMDKLQFMIMKHSLVTPRYSPMSEDVTVEELFTDLDEMAPVIKKYRPEVLETIFEIKKVVYYFENLQ